MGGGPPPPPPKKKNKRPSLLGLRECYPQNFPKFELCASLYHKI